MNKRLVLGSLTVPALVISLAACSGGGSAESSGDAAVADREVNLALLTDPTGFDPAKARITDDYYVDRLLFDTLVRLDDDGKLAGGLASSWETVSASEFVFTLRDGATCSDGTAITPTIVSDSLKRFADPKTGSSGRTQAFGDASAEFTPDDSAGTVTVKLSQDWSYLPQGLTLPHSGIVCPAGLADLEGLAAGTVDGAFSGPYTIVSATPAVGYELGLRDDYSAWPDFAKALEGTPPSSLTLRPYGDAATRATQLLAGGLDAATFNDDNISRFEGNADYTIADTHPAASYIIFNEREGSVFADNRPLREAVAQAIDMKAFVDVDTDGRGLPTASLASENIACVNTDTSLLVAHDPAAAKAALKGVSIRIVGATPKTVANEYVAEVLRDAGADVKLENVDIPNWSTVTSGASSEWDMTIQVDFNLTGSLASSLVRVMGPLANEGGRNKTGQINETGFGFLQASASATDEKARCEALESAQKSFLERIDAVPLDVTTEASVTVSGVSIRTFGDYIDPATVRLTK